MLGLGLVFVLSLIFSSSALGAGVRPALSALSHEGLAEGCGAVVDSQGDLYASDKGTVHIYDPAGAEITSFTSPEACQLAVDGTGALYVQEWLSVTETGGKVSKYVPSEFPPVATTTYSLDVSINESSPGAGDGDGVIDPRAAGVAVDPSTGDVYTSHPATNEKQVVTLEGMTDEVTTFTLGGLPAACDNSSTAPITFSGSGGERRIRIDNALEAACTGASPLGFPAINGGDFRVSNAAAPVIFFKGQFTGTDVPTLSCTSSEGTCSAEQTVASAPSSIAQRHSDGSLVTATIGSGVSAASYTGLGVYAANERVYALNAPGGKIDIFNPGAASPSSSISGSVTPAGSIGEGLGANLGEGLAVDQSNGHAYAYDAAHNVVNEFKPNGDYVTQLSNSFVDGTPSGVAADNSGGANDGDVYVVSKFAVDAFGAMSYDDQLTLSVIKTGSGDGRVESASPNINCGTTCDASLDPGAEVTLTATAETGSTFAGWTGCDSVEGTGNEICKVTVNASRAVTAIFVKRTLTVLRSGSGAGSVTSQPAGINCGATCEAAFDDGSEVILTPAADSGSKFMSWTGCDSVDQNDHCAVMMNDDHQVTARFDSRPIISEQRASEITQTSVRLSADINPEGTTTSYYFEYISDAAWIENGGIFAGKNPAGKVPIGPVAIGTTPRRVNISIEGLAPSTTYHFRSVATNEADTVQGERNGEDKEIQRTFTTYPESQVGTSCPNQALRGGASTSLPDCRAYEQATPVDKNGGSIQGKVPLTRASTSGDAISFESPAGIEGGTGSQEFPTYVGKRGANGWSPIGLLPSAATGQSAKWLGWNPAFSEVYDEVLEFGKGKALIAKSTVNGSEQTIVPYTLPAPTYAYVDSSSDGSTVVFEASSEKENTNLALTSKAAPGKPNVYVWERGDPGSIQLAGVLPDGSTPSAGSRSAALDEYTLDVHRVATDGSVYFTDLGTGEIYLRLNPTAPETSAKDGNGNCVPDPSHACTIPISASQKTNGKAKGNGMEGHDAAGPQPATFMAAAADGSSAFFLSSEKLTNNATTGPEPDLPAIARASKDDPSDKDLTFVPASAHAIAVDEAEGYIYWTDPGQSSIGRAKLDGSTDPEPDYLALPDVEQKPASFGPARPMGIAVIDQGEAKYIFWTEQGELDDEGEPKAEGGRIGRAGLDGGNLNQSCVKDISNPRSIAADSSYIYWTMPKVSNPSQGTVGRTELSCTGSVNTDLIEGFSVATGDIAVDASHIYVSRDANAFGDSFINQFEIDGSGPIFHGNFPIDVEHETGPARLAIDGSHLYWTNSSTSEIGRSELDGSNQDFNFITDAFHPEDIALDANNVYWSTSQKLVPNAGTDLYRYDRTDGKLHDLVVDHGDQNGAEVQGVAGVSEDGSFVYFVANGIPDNVGNSPNEEGETAQPGNCTGSDQLGDGNCNLYVYHDESVDFIARLHQGKIFNAGTSTEVLNEDGSGDAHDWIRGRVEVGKVEDDKTSRVSEDGHVLVFRSVLQLTKGYDNEGAVCGKVPGTGERIPGRCTEFYRFTYGDKSLTCISCDPRGGAPAGPARMGSIRAVSLGAVPGTAVLARNLSRNGGRFFFETPDALVASDVNGKDGCPLWGGGAQRLSSLACQDVYEWEAPETGSCTENSPAFSATSGGCIYLVSSGKSDDASFFADADPDGNNVFIFTYDRLVGQDEDSLLDVYDARVDGGLTGQNEVKAPPCPGEECKPPPSPPSAAQVAGSAGFSGPADPPVKRGHSKRKHKKHHHGKKKGKNGKRAHRAAGKDRGAGR